MCGQEAKGEGCKRMLISEGGAGASAAWKATPSMVGLANRGRVISALTVLTCSSSTPRHMFSDQRCLGRCLLALRPLFCPRGVVDRAAGLPAGQSVGGEYAVRKRVEHMLDAKQSFLTHNGGEVQSEQGGQTPSQLFQV